MTSIALPAPPARALGLGRSLVVGSIALLAGLLLAGLALVVLATLVFDFRILTVTSDSMAPAIRSGDLVIVKPVAIDRVAEGDVILFEAGGDRVPTVHRVIGINEIETRFRHQETGAVTSVTDYRLVTRGDANPAPDSREVTADELRGGVWFTIPRAGALAGRGVATTFAAIFATVMVAWVAWEGYGLLRRSRAVRP